MGGSWERDRGVCDRVDDRLLRREDRRAGRGGSVVRGAEKEEGEVNLATMTSADLAEYYDMDWWETHKESDSEVEDD